MGHRLTEVYTPAVSEHLEPGERVLFASLVVMKDPGVTKTVSWRDELKNLLDPTIWIGLGAHPGEGLRLLTFGQALFGGDDTTAARIHAALAETGSSCVAVTSLRLLIGSMEWSDGKPAIRTFKIVHSEPRSSIRDAERKPRRVRRGRVLVRCTDGSAVIIWAFRRHAPFLVAALNETQEEGDDGVS